MQTLPYGWIRALVVLASFTIVLGLLWWLKPVLIPFALATLFTFLASPIVTGIERRGVPRIAAVALVIGGAALTIGVVGTVLGKQLAALVEDFPRYEERLGQRLVSMREGQPQIVRQIEEVMDRIGKRLDAQDRRAGDATPPVSVRVVDDWRFFQWGSVWAALGPVVGPLATVGLTLVLVVFMLLRREDLRDRLIRLMGPRHLTATTRALDDAGERISRYLLLQLAINGGFGLAIGIGLALLGVPYAALFGVLAGLLRYIPYVGAWVSALLPLVLTLLVADGWLLPLAVIGLVVSLDVIANIFVEPYLYGRGVGVSQAAVLIMVAFWTWLWGPVGILLATPLTACLVVIGRHVGSLQVFDTLLGDTPVLEPEVRFYQRLVAHDVDEAADIAEQTRAGGSLVDAYDRLLVPALVAAAHDQAAGSLDDDDAGFVVGAARGLGETLAASDPPRAETVAALAGRPPVLVVPARAPKDLAAAQMLAAVLERLGFTVSLPDTVPLAAELPALLERSRAGIACVVALPPDGIAAARLFCMRLRPGAAKIIVVRPAPADARVQGQLEGAGADHVVDTLAAAEGLIVGLAPAPAGAPETLRAVAR